VSPRLSAGGFIRGLAQLKGRQAAWAWASLTVLGLRLALGAVMGSVWLAIRSYIPAALRVDTTLTGGRQYGLLAEAALAVWPRWDAVHYLNLARVGYFGVSVGDSVFYPLYPLLVRLAALVTGGDYLAAGLIVSTLAAIVTLAMLYQLAEQTFGVEAARWSVVALAVYPTSFFLLAPFSESTFLALTLAAFVAAGARRWWLAGLLAALASLARGPGILTAAALVFVAWRQRPQPAAGSIRQLPIGPVSISLILPLAGGGGFALWRMFAGFPGMNSVLLQYSGLELVDPLRGLLSAAVQFVQIHDLPTTLDAASALVFLGILVAMIVNPRWRVAEWLVYVALNLMVFFSKRSLVAASLQSLARYVLALFPAFIVMGDWLAHRGPRLRFVAVAASSSLLMILSVGYSLWWFIG
jgi:hypothetical protein